MTGPRDPEIVRTVTHLLRVERLTYSAISKKMGISRGSISNIVRRWIKNIPDQRIYQPKVIVNFGDVPIPQPPSPALIALAEFDPVIARALRMREAQRAADIKEGAEAP